MKRVTVFVLAILAWLAVLAIAGWISSCGTEPGTKPANETPPRCVSPDPIVAVTDLDYVSHTCRHWFRAKYVDADLSVHEFWWCDSWWPE